MSKFIQGPYNKVQNPWNDINKCLLEHLRHRYVEGVYRAKYSYFCLFVCLEFIVSLAKFSLMETLPLPMKGC